MAFVDDNRLRLPHAANDVQQHAGGNGVRSPMAQRRVQIGQIWFVEESN